jgi:hypothetical protein
VPTAGAKAVTEGTVFDLVADPLEREGRPSLDDELASLRAYLARDTQDLDALQAEVRSAILTASPDGNDASRLRALGYVD